MTFRRPLTPGTSPRPGQLWSAALVRESRLDRPDGLEDTNGQSYWVDTRGRDDLDLY
jgi:hypothetical protein